MKAGVMVSKRFMTSYLYVSLSTPAKLLYIAMVLTSDKDGNISKIIYGFLITFQKPRQTPTRN